MDMHDVWTDDESIDKNVQPLIDQVQLQNPALNSLPAVPEEEEDQVNLKIIRSITMKTKKTPDGGVASTVTKKLTAAVSTPGPEGKELWVSEKECVQECEMNEIGECINSSENVKSFIESRNGGLTELTKIEELEGPHVAHNLNAGDDDSTSYIEPMSATAGDTNVINNEDENNLPLPLPYRFEK